MQLQVLGSCPHGEALRNARHYQVRSIIATALKDADYNIFEEVHGLSVTGSTRRIDIIAFKESTKSGYIIDSTVRFKMNEKQPAEVDNEKKNIYNPTIPYYLQKYQLKELEVIGLLVRARGTATLFMKDMDHYSLSQAYNLFHDASLGALINLVIVKIIRLEVEEDEMNLSVTKDAERTLDTFCRWQKRMNPGDDDHPNHHDVAVLITRVRGAVACLLRNKVWEVYEEVHCVSEDDTHRRADIITLNTQQQKDIMIDPTIRMERDLNQSHQVDHEIGPFMTDICADEDRCGILGISKLAGTCDPDISCCVCEDSGLKLGYGIAHELAHS
ncbi:hypothetical protein ANN_15408 [Periplaneta americana]|uniref:Peptidase M12B domain-containing protein n=1 Tax=Periplaneta americana TaxID=6978 RepID=A0ABQ8SGB6_PERAM|nr:hypothetical protein ANN_15408 [Periplaneta americana]